MDRGKVVWENDLEKFKETFDVKWGRYLDVDGDGIAYRTLPGNKHQEAGYFARGTGHDEYAAYTEDNDQYLDIRYSLEVKKGVADAYVSSPQPEPAEPVSYSNTDYGFTLKYPGNWRERTENLGQNVIWRVGRGAYFVPSLRVIVLENMERADLDTAFKSHLQADGGKAIKTIATNNVKINGKAFTQADVTYGSGEYAYESMIIGRVKGGKWIIFEAFTVPAFGPFTNEGQKSELLNSIAFE